MSVDPRVPKSGLSPIPYRRVQEGNNIDRPQTLGEEGLPHKRLLLRMVRRHSEPGFHPDPLRGLGQPCLIPVPSFHHLQRRGEEQGVSLT